MCLSKSQKQTNNNYFSISLLKQQNKEEEKINEFHLIDEMRSLFHLALPTAAVQFCTFFIFPMTASAIGRSLDPEYLAGFSLASLSGNITCISIIVGSLTACETLQPRAFSLKQYEEVGLIAVRALVFCVMVLTPPILILYTDLYSILTLLGQDTIAAELASNWVRVYLWGVPSVLLFRVIQRFLACQSIVVPCAYAAILGLMIQPLLLICFMRSFSYSGSALALVCTQWLQLLFSFWIVNFTKSFTKETWPQFNMNFIEQAVNWKGMYSYGKLGMGGVLSLSEWWFWEVICFIAGKFGIVPLCVHSIAYQLIPLSFMLPLGISMGLSIRLGATLTYDVSKAKMLVSYTIGLTILIALLVCIGIYHYQAWIINMFTNDEAVFAGCSKIWWKVCIDIFFLYILGINGGILRALGMQWQMAATVFIVLWCIALPVITRMCIYQDGGLDLMWSLIPITYFILNLCLSFCYITADWNAISASISDKAKGEAKQIVIDESALLL